MHHSPLLKPILSLQTGISGSLSIGARPLYVKETGPQIPTDRVLEKRLLTFRRGSADKRLICPAREKEDPILAFPAPKRLKVLLVFLFLALGLSLSTQCLAFPCDLEDQDSARLKERIEFVVGWSFIPLVDTYLETYRIGQGEEPDFYRITHKAAMNSFWNDRMVSIINPQSLLPCQMQTIVKDGEKQWKEGVIFDREMGKARLFRQDHEDGRNIVNSVDITPTSMDPLSAFYYLRKRISPARPSLELHGITGSRRFTLKGKIVGEETITVPAGTFNTYRCECSLDYSSSEEQKTDKASRLDSHRENPFTLWITQDDQRFPIQIRYQLLLGSLWVRAISVRNYDGIFDYPL
jgi:hypothetical protein